MERQGRLIQIASFAFLIAGLASVSGLAERLAGESTEIAYLVWPFSFLYFWPLVIPLGTYIVIARWTGYKHFKHA